ncbi:MAG: HD domain-containing protein [Candidatus Omnitrophica bacterium]|nr:HD domain-containing protein [Candidatus Omnitrophota bacterium]
MNAEKILFISNDEKLSAYLRDELGFKRGYNISMERSAAAGIAALKDNGFDIVITKLNTPELDSIALIKELKKIDQDCVVILNADEPLPEVMQHAYKIGVYDVINKNTNPEKLAFIVKKGIELHSILSSSRKFISSIEEQNLSLHKQNILLAKRIEESTKNLTRLYEDLRETYMLTIKALAQAIDAKDHYTHSHSQNVQKYAVMLAEEMRLSAKDTETIRHACELHDLGKIAVHDNILTKETPLTPEEWEQIKLHALKGAQILESLTFLEDVVVLVKHHHEHWDGTGYPAGFKGEQIPLGARIIHIADAYDAMTSARAYRKVPLTKKEAVEEIKKNSGSQFDPKIVEAFFRILDRI